MDKKTYGRYPKKRILIADLVSLVTAWFCALMIRYDNWADRFDGLYLSICIFMCMVQIIIFLMIDSKRRSVFVMDPVENMIAVLRNCTINMALTVLYLYATQRGKLSSRFVIGMIYLLSIVFDFIARMIIRRMHNKAVEGVQAVPPLVISHPYPDISLIQRQIDEKGCKEVIIYKGDATDTEYDQAAGALAKTGIRLYSGLEIPGYKVKSGIACDVDGYTTIPLAVRKEEFTVFGVNYAIARIEEAVLHVMRNLSGLSGKYICFSNTHTLVMARENEEYRNVLNGSAHTFADGNPIAKLQMKSGLTGVERVAGPDFMEHMFKDTADGSISHYFYGSSQETLDALYKSLKEKYPDINIKGMYSPPYRELTEAEDEEDVRRINESGADIIWIGLGAPKQEKWMADHKDRIHGVMMGVGAGFDFHAGTIRRAPVWVQKIGMEWLYRLFQDPGRLFKRYVVTNCKFYIYRLMERFDH